jgi:ATP-dependent Clp protease ATP-binding subunit ClpA
MIMPKINVYLSEELAAAVKQAGVPVSPVCQQALTEAVAKITTARRAVEAIRDPSLSRAAMARLSEGVTKGLTARLATVLDLARTNAGIDAGGSLVSTGQLLLGLIDEGGNLALSIVQSLDVDLDELRSAAERQLTQAEAAADPAPDAAASAGGSPRTFAPGEVALQLDELTMPGRLAVASAFEASIGLGHNYVGCEHLLLGLLSDVGGQAGRALAELGVGEAAVKRAMTSVLAGFAHGRRWAGSPSASQFEELASRIEALERQLAESRS